MSLFHGVRMWLRVLSREEIDQLAEDFDAELREADEIEARRGGDPER